MYWCREIRNTDDSPLFRYETFINFLTRFFTRGERERERERERVTHTHTHTHTHNCYYADCTIWPNKRAAHHIAPSWSGPAQSRISTDVFFKITKFLAHRFRAWRHSHPNHISYLGFLLWHLWLSYPLRANMNCTQWVCICTDSRIVQSPTKPNDKI